MCCTVLFVSNEFCLLPLQFNVLVSRLLNEIDAFVPVSYKEFFYIDDISNKKFLSCKRPRITDAPGL